MEFCAFTAKTQVRVISLCRPCPRPRVQGEEKTGAQIRAGACSSINELASPKKTPKKIIKNYSGIEPINISIGPKIVKTNKNGKNKISNSRLPTKVDETDLKNYETLLNT